MFIYGGQVPGAELLKQWHQGLFQFQLFVGIFAMCSNVTLIEVLMNLPHNTGAGVEEVIDYFNRIWK